jgi:hypothetical protein
VTSCFWPSKMRGIKRLGLALGLLALAGLLASCAPTHVGPVTLNPEFSRYATRTVAVLPFDNMSPNLDATPLVRPIVNERLRHLGYQVKPLQEVDRILQQNGVMISHDVYAFTPAELGRMLGVDAVLFGTVTDFNTKYAVVYSSVAVGVKLELKDCRDGEQLWQNSAFSSRNTAVESVLILLFNQDKTRAFTEAAVYSTAFAVLKSYRPYAEDASRLALDSLPPGPLGPRPYPFDVNPGLIAGDEVEIWVGVSHGIVTAAPGAVFQVRRP